jgi:choline dehydrogenase-like flavoprotein
MEADHGRQLAALARRMLRKASGYIVDGVGSPPGSGIHYVGTCRMASDPKGGVADKDLKYFKSKNLSVCDGSVIPALSEKHPTLTIMGGPSLGGAFDQDLYLTQRHEIRNVKNSSRHRFG